MLANYGTKGSRLSSNNWNHDVNPIPGFAQFDATDKRDLIVSHIQGVANPRHTLRITDDILSDAQMDQAILTMNHTSSPVLVSGHIKLDVGAWLASEVPGALIPALHPGWFIPHAVLINPAGAGAPGAAPAGAQPAAPAAAAGGGGKGRGRQ